MIVNLKKCSLKRFKKKRAVKMQCLKNAALQIQPVRKIVRKIEKLQVGVMGADPQSAYLHSGFSQVDLECQLLPSVDIRVVGLCKDPFQLLQLGAGERGPDAPLLPLLVQSAVVRE